MTIALPPYAALMGIIAEPGPAAGDPPVLRMDFTHALEGRPGHLHGGATAGLLEMAAHAALTASLGGAAPGSADGAPRFKPIGITIDYMRPGRSLPTFARGRVTRVGSRVATVIVEAWQEEGGPQIAAARLHMLLARDEKAAR